MLSLVESKRAVGFLGSIAGRARHCVTLAVFALAVGTGCPGETTPAPPDGGSLGQGGLAGGTGQGGGGGAVAGMGGTMTADAGAATAVEFQLVNESARTIFLQSGAFWQLVQDNTTLTQRHCGQCDCSSQCDRCAVCARALASVEELAPGAMLSFTWDGRVWVRSTCGSGRSLAGLQCVQGEAAAAGPFEVHVTYSFTHGVDTSAGGSGSGDVIGEAVLVKRGFVYPVSSPVVVKLQ